MTKVCGMVELDSRPALPRVVFASQTPDRGLTVRYMVIAVNPPST